MLSVFIRVYPWPKIHFFTTLRECALAVLQHQTKFDLHSLDGALFRWIGAASVNAIQLFDHPLSTTKVLPKGDSEQTTTAQTHLLGRPIRFLEETIVEGDGSLHYVCGFRLRTSSTTTPEKK